MPGTPTIATAGLALIFVFQEWSITTWSRMVIACNFPLQPTREGKTQMLTFTPSKASLWGKTATFVHKHRGVHPEVMCCWCCCLFLQWFFCFYLHSIVGIPIGEEDTGPSSPHWNVQITRPGNINYASCYTVSLQCLKKQVFNTTYNGSTLQKHSLLAYFIKILNFHQKNSK